MAATKNKKKGTAKRTTGKNTKKKQQQPAPVSFQNEIILLVTFAACVILFVSNLGMGGFVGDAISGFCFGTMGMLAYLFPFVFFLAVAFLLTNRGKRLMYKKLAAGFVCFLTLCGAAQLLFEGYMTSTTLRDYYTMSADYKTGGGVIGGAVCISTTSAFGTVGSYVIIILVILVCVIIITQRSFLDFLTNIFQKIYELFKGGHERYMEGQPERDLKKELRAQQRRQQRQERRAEKIRRLEEALAEEDFDEEEETDTFLNPKRARAEKTGFLEGTKLTGEKETPKKKTSKKAEENADTEEDFEDFETAKESRKKSRKKKETADAIPAGEGQMEFRIQRAADAEEPEDDFDPWQQDFENPDLEDPAFDEIISENFYSEETEMLDREAEKMDYREEETFDTDSGDVIYGESSFESEPPVYGYSDEAVPAADLPQKKRGAASSGKKTSDDHTAAVQEPAPHSRAKNPRSSGAEIENGIVNIRHEISQGQEQEKKEYQFPPLKLLKKGDGKSQGDSDAYLRKTAQKLQEVLHNFGVNVTVINVSCGPTVTRYELQPEMGVKVSRIVSLADDIKLNLATPDIRIEAPIPGKAAVGIEVPNKENSDLIQSEEFRNAKSSLAFAAGKDIAGKTVVADIAKMPHLLIAGATGSGKSVCINTLIISLLYKAKPEEVRLIMIDPKVVELSVYNGIPHLLIPVVTDPKKAAGALNWAVTEMTNRYNLFAEYGVRNLGEYNKKINNIPVGEGETRPSPMPQIVIIVDELADLMMVAPGEVEDAICRLAQLARAAGIHLIIATQRPSVNVITGLIKANMPSRIAFSVSSGVDSRTILDMNGAEKLLGKGDMLFYPQGYQKPARLQGAFVSDEEVSSIVEFLANKNPSVQYNTQIEQQVNSPLAAMGSPADDRDVYFEEAGKFIIEKEKASIGMLQRMFKIGFNRAARIMDQLCDAGVVGPEEGTKPRKVLMSMEEFQSYMEESA